MPDNNLDLLDSSQWAAYCEKERTLVGDWGTERQAKHDAYVHQSQPGNGSHRVTYRKRKLVPFTSMRSTSLKNTSFDLPAATEPPRQFHIKVLKKRL